MINDLKRQRTSSVTKIRNALSVGWSRETSYFDNWSPNNPSAGQCAVSALILQDYCGGEIRKCMVAGVPHYFNVINDQVVDSTVGQFAVGEIEYHTSAVREKGRILRHADTFQRYELLCMRVAQFLAKLDKVADEIASVDYGCMGEDCLQKQMIWFGDNNDIVIVGEAPARTGWVKSGVAWHNTDGKLLPSGIIMQKLLTILNKELLSVTFLEAIKCFPSDRRHLKKLAQLYRPTLERQIKILRPKLVLTMGAIPTQMLIDRPFQRLTDVAGKSFSVHGTRVIPIFHPSPISPRGYKDNVPIFEMIQRKIWEEV